MPHKLALLMHLLTSRATDLHFTSDSRVMGEFVNRGPVKVVCWFLAALVIVINFYLVTTFVTAPDS